MTFTSVGHDCDLHLACEVRCPRKAHNSLGNLPQHDGFRHISSARHDRYRPVWPRRRSPFGAFGLLFTYFCSVGKVEDTSSALVPYVQRLSVVCKKCRSSEPAHHALAPSHWPSCYFWSRGRDRLVSWTRDATRASGLTTWEGVQATLTNCLWIDHVFNKSGMSIFHEALNSDIEA